MTYSILKELLVFHGGPDVVKSGIKVPFFTTPSEDGATYYAMDRSNSDGNGTLNRYDLNTTSANTLDADKDFGKFFQYAVDEKVDMDVSSHEDLVNEPFWSDEIAKHGMDGSNVSDLVYIPRFREAVLRDGFKIVKISDTLTNDEIIAYIVLDPSVITFTGATEIPGDQDDL